MYVSDIPANLVNTTKGQSLSMKYYNSFRNSSKIKEISPKTSSGSLFFLIFFLGWDAGSVLLEAKKKTEEGVFHHKDQLCKTLEKS